MSYFDSMTVTVPEGSHGAVRIRRITIGSADRFLGGFSSGHGSRGRGVREGDVFTGLYRDGALWMSDTPDEKRDHYEVLRRAGAMRAERVLINGLGLGMIVNALLQLDHVAHIDVVEIDADVIALVGEHYQAAATAAGKSLTIHHGDAYTIAWPPGTRWDVAWHDIWVSLCTDNLDTMAVLHRRYGRRTGWQGSWGKELLIRRRRVEVREEEQRRALRAVFTAQLNRATAKW